MPGDKFRAWVFEFVSKPALDVEDAPILPPQPDVNHGWAYATGQLELKDDGLVFHGYAENAAAVSRKHLLRWLGALHPQVEGVRLEEPMRTANIARATRLETRDRSELLVPWVHGALKPRGGAEATKAKWEAVRDRIRADPSQDTMRALATEFPELFIKHSQGLEAMRMMLDVAPKRTDVELRPFQAKVLELVKGKADNRQIYWFYDPDGLAGKSTLVNLLVRNHGAIMLEGTERDMIYAYHKEPIVCIDLPRAADVNNLKDIFKIAESLKNGMIFNTKYQSALKVFDPPWVFIFSNSLPPPGIWTHDRLKLVAISGVVPPPFHVHAYDLPEVAVEPDPLDAALAAQAKIQADAEAAAAAAAEHARDKREEAEARAARARAAETEDERSDDDGGGPSAAVRRAQQALRDALAVDRERRKRRRTAETDTGASLHTRE